MRCRAIGLIVTAAIAIASAGMQAQNARQVEGAVPPPTFPNPKRASALAAAFPEIERSFAAWTERVRAPGAAMGVIIDGELAWAKTIGVADVATRAPVTPDTVFRIASMTKSFTALAILRLRDEGKLSLDDPVSTHVSELAGLQYPTRDSPVLTVRHLLTHSEGFPEDNPWGDQQLARPQETMTAWLRRGIPFSTVPGTAYEYSNYGFAILGQIVERVAKQPYDAYVAANILVPLGMRDSVFDVSRVPADRIGRGYRWEDERWKPEIPLAHGTFGAMGGLWTTTRDLARYVAFQMSAWPPRDEPERGPVRRSSVREMQQGSRSYRARVSRPSIDGPLEMSVGAYGYGLGVTQSCAFGHIVAHGGGLPGYGSLMRWLPEYGVGLIGMANITYAGFGGVFTEAFAALAETGALEPRVVQPSRALTEAKADVSRLVVSWDPALANRIAADNLFLDQSAERREARFKELAAVHGACRPDPGIVAENALRGTWRMTCDRGRLDVAITLAPTMPPAVQYLNVTSVMPPGPEMTKALESARLDIAARAAAWGACRLGDTVGGDGVRESAVTLACDRGTLIARAALDPATGRMSRLDLAPSGRAACVP